MVSCTEAKSCLCNEQLIDAAQADRHFSEKSILCRQMHDNCHKSTLPVEKNNFEVTV